MSERQEYSFHPYADIFPLMPENSKPFEDLLDSLKANTMLVPILIYDGQILDGRNRYRAYLKDSSIELKTEEFIGSESDALQRSLALNNQRRAMDESQRALAALRLSSLQSGMKLVERQKWAAELFNVSYAMIRLAADIMHSDNQEKSAIIDLIEDGELAVTAAHGIMKNLQPAQWEQAALDGKKARDWIKRSKRQEREITFARDTVSANRKLENTDSVYGVIYTDPPWTFETYSENGKDRSAENHYPTMTLEDIRDMKIPAAENCALFMWVTIPHLANGLEILKHWGFEYKSSYFWHKLTKGTGYWSANEVEMLLLAVREPCQPHCQNNA